MRASVEPELLLVALDFLKARPVEEGGKRYVYCTASNEARDQQGERIMKAALLESRDLFLAKGNIDIDHMTLIGYKFGVDNPRSFEIGLPMEVADTPDGVLVKGSIYSGNERADWWWKTQTEQTPPMPWYPSVGGRPTHKAKVWDKEHGCHTNVILKCDWKNLAFAREAQNRAVPAVQLMPYAEFAKGVILGQDAITCDGDVCTCNRLMVKTVTAGADIGPAGLTGGGALRLQSIDRGVHDPFKSHASRFLKAMADGGLGCGCAPSSLAALRGHFAKCEGMSGSESKVLAARVLGHVGQKLHKHAA